MIATRRGSDAPSCDASVGGSVVSRGAPGCWTMGARRSTMPEPSMLHDLAPGFIVASPALLDPNFTRTVVLLVAHNADGALGFIVNRPMTGLTIEHALFFLYGTGANGKSVFCNVVAAIHGDYATTAPMDMFMATTGERHPTDLAGLRGARFVSAVETEQGAEIGAGVTRLRADAE